METLYAVADDGLAIFTRHWATGHSTGPRAVLHITHGMAEHGGRYEPVAGLLNQAGIAVYAHDHRGHGEMIRYGQQGHFADGNGWQKVVDDVYRVNREIHKRYPGVPVFLLGHSMGSFIAQQYAMDYRGTIQGLALSGSNYDAPLVYRTARGIARVEKLRGGGKAYSRLLNYLSFGSFNKHFAPNRTEFDWLSRDSIEVDRYIADPWCGFLCTNQLWVDLLGGLTEISDPQNLSRLPHDLPVYILGGSQDPVSNMGQGLQRLADIMREAGIGEVASDIYADGRHEMFNETNREIVVENLLDWVSVQL